MRDDARAQNHNPFASGDGPGPALDVLGPIWPRTQITVLGTKFNSPMSWLHYRNSMSGEIVDRYRWVDGCIVEHVSKYPLILSFPQLDEATTKIDMSQVLGLMMNYCHSGIKGRSIPGINESSWGRRWIPMPQSATVSAASFL